MEAFAMFAAVMGKSVQPASTSSAPPPETVQETTAEPEAVAEPTAAVSEPTAAETREDEADLAAGLELLTVSAPRLGSATEGETPVLEDRVVGVSEGETPVTNSRVEGETPQKEEEMLGPEATTPEKAESPRPSRGESDAEERRHAAEKKRKGKQIVPSKTKKAKGKSTKFPLPLPAKVPYAAEPEDSAGSSESEEEQEEELNFEPTEIGITSKLLDEMRKFDDPKRATIHKEKSAQGNTAEVPIDLAREFFSTFRFKSTIDLNADSIKFRLFYEEHVMSIREWTLRMGLLTRTEDDEGLWSERMIGPPKLTPGFKTQNAWEFVAHPRGRDVCFYEVGQSEAQTKQEPEMVEAKDTADMEAGARIEVEEGIVALRDKGRDRAEDAEVRKLVEEVRSDVENVRKEVIGVRKKVTEIRRKMGRSREEVVALKGRITDLLAESSRRSDRMAEAVAMMMKMTKWLQAKFPETPMGLSAPSGDSKTPGQGSLAVQKPPQAQRPQTTPSSSRPIVMTFDD
ncbi:uncharacterized protein LOC121745914 [Salvia splendens]|uniref:uncharacterized protein LOC121745914 n=1 Tax=Salvia splendens TaxID=180675 RepID=UPI001C26B93C|nr:uncharacterized protein LOC121745914 [Salvia splendens]